MNLYNYVRGNPVNWIDPLGLKLYSYYTYSFQSYPDGSTVTWIVEGSDGSNQGGKQWAWQRDNGPFQWTEPQDGSYILGNGSITDPQEARRAVDDWLGGEALWDFGGDVAVACLGVIAIGGVAIGAPVLALGAGVMGVTADGVQAVQNPTPRNIGASLLNVVQGTWADVVGLLNDLYDVYNNF